MKRLRLMADALVGILRQLKSKRRSLEIKDDITILWVEGANQENQIIWDEVLGMRRSGVGRERTK